MRTTIVSTTKLKNYKTIIFVIDGLVLISIISLVFYMYATGEHIISSTIPLIIYLQFHMYFGLFLKLKTVSYDDSSIYYNKKGYEVQVPFEDIASVEIRSVTGIYGIKLYNPSQGSKEILFKTSLWYPFNFKKQDEKVDELRDRINKYKRTLPEKTFAALPSYKL